MVVTVKHLQPPIKEQFDQNLLTFSMLKFRLKQCNKIIEKGSKRYKTNSNHDQILKELEQIFKAVYEWAETEEKIRSFQIENKPEKSNPPVEAINRLTGFLGVHIRSTFRAHFPNLPWKNDEI